MAVSQKAVEAALRYMGVAPTGERPGWVHSHCPYASLTHRGGVDKHPSFGIRYRTKPMYHCWSCGESGDMDSLPFDLKARGLIDGFQARKAFDLLAQDEGGADLDLLDYDEVYESKGPKVHRFDEQWANSFPEAARIPAALDYLAGRGFDDPVNVCQQFGLRFDTGDNRLCFTIRDWNGRLVGFHGRDITGTSSMRYKAYKHKGHYNKSVWYGEAWVDPDEPVVIVESVFDLLKVWHVYPNVICPVFASLSEEKVRRINRCLNLITMCDYGTAGDMMRARLTKGLPDALFRHVVLTEEQGDPGEMTFEAIAEALVEYLC